MGTFLSRRVAEGAESLNSLCGVHFRTEKLAGLVFPNGIGQQVSGANKGRLWSGIRRGKKLGEPGVLMDTFEGSGKGVDQGAGGETVVIAWRLSLIHI